MSLSSVVYLISMLTVFVGQRLLVESGSLQTGVTALGVAGLLAAAVLRWRKLGPAKNDGLRLGHRTALMFLLVGVASLVLYAATSESVARSLSLAEVSEERWLGVWSSMWPLVWLLGTVPMLAVDYAVQSSPVAMPRRRVRDLALHGLIVAMGVGIAFPVNYIASQKKERWDLAYFKTPQPGTATVALAQALEAPVDVRIFMPPSSEVAQELRGYFAPLEGPTLRVQVIDQAAEPQLAKALSVRDNGTVTFTQGELKLSVPGQDAAEQAEDDDAPMPVTRSLKVSPDYEKAKRSLKKVDGEVQKLLIELGQGERIAYVTSGHGEASWNNSKALDRQLKGLRDELKQLGFTVRELGLRQNLAQGVPEDADFVAVIGALHPLQQLEVQSLRTYLEGGGSLFIAFEPTATKPSAVQALPDPLAEMVAEVMGVTFEPGILADARNHVPLFNNQQDNYLVGTDSYSAHASNPSLASERSPLFMPISGHLLQVEGHPASAAITVRSLATTWADLDGNAKFDADADETKGARNVVAAVTGGSGDVSWRALVSADASLVTDWALGNDDVPPGSMPGVGMRGNRQFVRDGMNWLIGAEALSGTTQNEEDVKIEHSKEDQIWWFYLTALGVPLLVFAAGALRVYRRRNGPGARA